MNQIAIDFAVPRARRGDPSTSHDAAASMRKAASAQAAAVLADLRRHGPAGASTIAARSGLTQIQVCRRLPELREAGLARPTDRRERTAAGRSERVWAANP
jgi:predicted ArsR family transcriptional regulator